jgi:gluconolactonase
MVSKPILIADGLGMTEGPVWCDDGTLVVTSVADHCVWRIWPETKRKEVFSRSPGGGANGLAPATDGYLLMTQNGGIDMRQSGLPGDWPEVRYVSGGLELIDPKGEHTRLLAGFTAPNDLVVGPDNVVYFTDPPRYPMPPNSRDAKIVSWNVATGEVRNILVGMNYCNGIVREADGNLVATVENGLLRVSLDGHHEWIMREVSKNHATDGFCLDADGRFYLASVFDHGIRVIEGRKEIDFWPIPTDGNTTNCCFGGPDNRWLFATDGANGKVFMWTDVPTPGLPLHPWKVPAAYKSCASALAPKNIMQYERDA